MARDNDNFKKKTDSLGIMLRNSQDENIRRSDSQILGFSKFLQELQNEEGTLKLLSALQ